MEKIIELTLERFDSNYDPELWTDECYDQRGQHLRSWNNQELQHQDLILYLLNR